MRSGVLVAGILLGACGAGGQSQLGTGAISGTVKDSTSALVAGAQIQLAAENFTGMYRCARQVYRVN